MQVAIFLIQRNRHALIGRAIDDHDMERVLQFLKNDPVCFLSLFFHMMKSKPINGVVTGCGCCL